MRLSDLFGMLSTGELSNLTLGNDGAGTIKAGKEQQVVNYINEGLLRLYGRFVLKEKELLLEQIPHQTSYELVPKFARSYVPVSPEVAEPIYYIHDTPQLPFIGDIIKILAVFNDCKCPIPLNDESEHMSVFTPQANLLQVPCVHPGRFLSLIYQARHPKLTTDLNSIVELPDILVGALTAYVAYKAYSHMNTEVSTAKAQEHMSLYESVCADAVDKDLINATVSTNNLKFSKRGWR
jgi:hypothetical protein